MHTKFWSANLKGRNYSEDQSVSSKIILEYILVKLCENVWMGYMWLRIGTES